jgi:hypothetical protein
MILRGKMDMAHRMYVFLFTVMILMSEIVVANAAQTDTRSVAVQREKVDSVVWQKAQKNGTVRVLVQMNVAIEAKRSKRVKSGVE